MKSVIIVCFYCKEQYFRFLCELKGKMMEFKKYQHIERLGTPEVNGILDGTCYIFPKLDGTNGSIWWNNGLQFGSRNRWLKGDDPQNDNQGFKQKILWDGELVTKLIHFFRFNPTSIIYGEWLVPHTIKEYRKDCWNKFYIFDVYLPDLGGELHPRHYEKYVLSLDASGLSYIPPLAIIENPSEEQLYGLLDTNTYCMKDGHVGEGIVIKNYDFVNRYGRTTWAKIVRNEFRDKQKAKSCGITNGPARIEIKIVDKYVTTSFVEKTYAKIVAQAGGWEPRHIPQLLGRCYHDLVDEEAWNFVKEFKNPTIDFKKLQRLCEQKVKEIKPEIF